MVKIIGGIKIDYQITGEGRVLLLLHGWALEMSKEKYRKLVGELAKKYKVVALDFPGFGGSSLPPKPWGVREYADLVASFVNALNLRVFGIVGHSFGGRIAIKFAVLYPERLKKLILCASAGIKHPLNFFQKIIFKLAIFGNFLFSKRPFKRFKDVAHNFFYTFLRQKDYAKAKGIMKETLKKVLEEDLRPELSQIKINTLLIWGEKDKAVPIKDAYLMKEHIPQSVLEIIPGASHTPNLEMPEKIADIVGNFLANNKRI